MAAASYLAQSGYDVHLYEKHDQLGGRARIWKKDGYLFDLGPSWYWMPDVFEQFFQDFGRTTKDFYDLKRLDPSYRIYFEDEVVDLPANLDELGQLFEQYEPGSAAQLKRFMKDAGKKYEASMSDLVFRPSLSAKEFVNWKVLRGLASMHLLKPFTKYIRRYFKHPKIHSILEFPILFLGAKPANTPALYSLMNYADIQLGTWYPDGGMNKIVSGMTQILEEQNVQVHTTSEVGGFSTNDHIVNGVKISENVVPTDLVVAGADYHHVEKLLPESLRSYDKAFWDKQTMAPSSLIFYLGVDKKLPGLKHHNLFFDRDFGQHAVEIYDQPGWPSDPLFYVCCPSRTDSSVAPENCENLFILMPVASGIKDSEETRERYYDLLMERLEARIGCNVRDHVTVKRSYAHRDFVSDYHSYRGNAYGLANTLKQTAVFKPKMQSKRVRNLYFCGQLTVPGPGVPPALISGKVVANLIKKQHKL